MERACRVSLVTQAAPLDPKIDQLFRNHAVAKKATLGVDINWVISLWMFLIKWLTKDVPMVLCVFQRCSNGRPMMFQSGILRRLCAGDATRSGLRALH